MRFGWLTLSLSSSPHEDKQNIDNVLIQAQEAERLGFEDVWLTEHYLMIRDDSAACDIVASEITQTLEPFWHKSNVICQAVQGNPGGARFAADILAANGF